MIAVPDEVSVIVTIFHINPPHAKGVPQAEAEIAIVDVFAFRVQLSGILKAIAVQFIVLAPNVIVFVAVVPPLLNEPQVTVCQLVFKVHFLTSKVAVPVFNVSCNVHHPHTPSKAIVLASVTVLHVTVFQVDVELNVIAHVYVLVIPLTSDRLPYIFRAVDPAHVGAHTSGFPHVMSAQKASLSMVTV